MNARPVLVAMIAQVVIAMMIAQVVIAVQLLPEENLQVHSNQTHAANQKSAVQRHVVTPDQVMTADHLVLTPVHQLLARQ
jgi:hypothetical protein